MTLGEKIRFLRVKNNLSQEALAQALKTTKQAIYKYENGIVTNIPLEKVEALSNILNTTPAYLMGWENDSQSSVSPLDGFHLQMFSSPDSANSPNRQKLIDWAMSVPEDKVEPVLQALETILAILK